MQVWTVANQKGGVGKTTTSIALGGLAAEEGLRVLLLDLDPHGSLTSYLGYDPDQLTQGNFNLFQQRQQLTREFVLGQALGTAFPNIFLMAASTALATLERQAIGEGMGLVIARALTLITDDIDLVIIDCPPLLGVLMVNALAACERLIVPVQTEHLALKGLERMVHTLTMMTRSRNKPLDYVVVPTMFDRRTQASISSMRIVRNQYPERVWAGKIPVDTRLRDASKAGVPPSLFDPDSRGVAAYHSLYKWLKNQPVAE